MQVDGVQRAPSYPSLSNADAAKVESGTEEEYGKNAHEVLTKPGREKESISMYLSLCHPRDHNIYHNSQL